MVLINYKFSRLNFCSKIYCDSVDYKGREQSVRSFLGFCRIRVGKVA